MLSAIILTVLDYPAFTYRIRTGRFLIRSPGSFRTTEKFLQYLLRALSDMDQTVSRRSEPSSRTAFMGEQPNPWHRLPRQVAMSRHRGAKPSRRYELLKKISLLSLE